jgi:hypothetical protein
MTNNQKNEYNNLHIKYAFFVKYSQTCAIGHLWTTATNGPKRGRCIQVWLFCFKPGELTVKISQYQDQYLLRTSWATQLCLGFLLLAISLCLSVFVSLPLSLCLSPLSFYFSHLSLYLSNSPIYLSIFLFLPSISLSFYFSHLSLYLYPLSLSLSRSLSLYLSFSPIYLSIYTIYLSIYTLYLYLSPLLPCLFPDKKFPALGQIPSFRSKFGDNTFI